MKILRGIVFFVSLALIVWFLGPLYKSVVHIGMLYPLPFLAMFALFAAKPDLLVLLFKKFKVLSIICSSLIGIGIVVFVSLVSVMLVYANNTPNKGETVIVLGCQVIGENPTIMLNDRMNAALEYLNENPESNVVASGGKGPGESISEAQAIKRFLMSRGISESRIFVEDKSVNTEENIKFSAELINENKLNNNVAIATDSFHEFRAKYHSDRNNLNASALTCNTRWYFSASYYAREVLAVIKMLLF